MVNDNTCGICKPHLDKFGGLFDAPENSPECASRVLHSPDVTYCIGLNDRKRE